MRKATTPFLAEPSSPEFGGDDMAVDQQEIETAERALRGALERGQTQGLKPYAAKVLMKVLYAARYARFDLLRAVCYLAQYITKWDDACDRRLYRLM